MIQILLVDDHLAVAEGTKVMIEQENDMQVMILQDSVETIEVLKRHSFDVIMVDLKMPKINGIDLIKRIRKIHPDVSILIYTGYDIEDYFNMLVEYKVSGFISKTSTREQIIAAIRAALRNDAIIPISLMHKLRVSATTEEIIEDDIIPLSEKELQILREVSYGYNNKEIARNMYLSQRTIEYHLTNIFKKLNVKSRVEAVYKAQKHSLFDEFVKGE